jgi:hypothetical protein
MTVSFKDFMIVDYRPGEPEEINYRAHKRKRNTNLNGVEEKTRASRKFLEMMYNKNMSKKKK